MRPVDKGAPPAQVYAVYGEALPDLVARLGRYCSYCERWIETHLAVEHVQPKLLVQALLLNWTNFLLACVNCNSCKGSVAITLADYFWPDSDNTLRAFEYSQGGVIAPNPALAPVLQAKATASLGLTGLDRYPGGPGERPTQADLRWMTRFETWSMAHKALARLQANDSVELREQIAETAATRGLFSIWWTVFAMDADMRRRFREAFAGTHAGCFDTAECVVQRIGGQV
jgi:uncharacterized protein (TIGR02646 family)